MMGVLGGIFATGRADVGFEACGLKGWQVKSVFMGSCVLAIAYLLVAVPSIAVADGDPLEGMTYADASAAVGKGEKSAKIVVSSAVGSRLQRDDCLVTHSKRSVMIDGTGKYVGVSYFIDLNCNGALATAASPGNSLASAMGKTQKERLQAVDTLNANPDLCNTSAEVHKNCVTMCNELEPGKCTFEIS